MTFTVTGRDKNGNVINYDGKTDKFKLYAAQESQNGEALEFSEITGGTLVTDSNVQKIRWTLPFTSQGNYELFATYNEKKVKCEVCKMTVNPDVFSFEDSTMQYLDPWVMYSVDWQVTETVYEENMIDQPFYTFMPRDQYGNLITDPATLPTDISTVKVYIIDGQDYTDYTQSPVEYETSVFESNINIQVRANDPQNSQDENEQAYA